MMVEGQFVKKDSRKGIVTGVSGDIIGVDFHDGIRIRGYYYAKDKLKIITRD